MSQLLDNTVRNLRLTFEDLTLQKLIRIVIIVGAYVLLRPYLLKLTSHAQMEQHEAPLLDPNAPRAKISPNSLRGQVDIPEDSGDEDDTAEGSSADWGKKARRRQREVLKKLLDAEEERLAQLQEDEEDKDIEEFLEK